MSADHAIAYLLGAAVALAAEHLGRWLFDR